MDDEPILEAIFVYGQEPVYRELSQADRTDLHAIDQELASQRVAEEVRVAEIQRQRADAAAVLKALESGESMTMKQMESALIVLLRQSVPAQQEEKS